MRYIDKTPGQPEPILSYLDAQITARKANPDAPPSNFPIDYGSFGGAEKRYLQRLLFQEQGGLCAYTGASIEIEPKLLSESPYYHSHIEHLKPQELCRKELIDSGGVVGADVGEDMDYHNMVAALAVSGSSAERFGAVENTEKTFPKSPENPVLPTQSDCESRFSFDPFGGIKGSDAEANQTIARLKLDHETLNGWRKQAIRKWVSDDMSDVEIREALDAVSRKADGQLPEFCFVVADVIRNYYLP